MRKSFLRILVRHLFIEFGRAHLRDSGISTVRGSCREENYGEKGKFEASVSHGLSRIDKTEKQLATIVLALSSAEAPSVEKRRENGEFKNRGLAGVRGGGGGRAPTEKTKESSCGGEGTFSAILVQHIKIYHYIFFFTSRTCILKIFRLIPMY